MEPLGRFPRVLNGVPRENIEGPPRPDPRPKTRGAAGPEGFWPRVWPRGAFNILSRDSIEYSRNLPRGSIHHYTPKAFPQIVILSRSRRNQVKQNKQTNNIKKTARTLSVVLFYSLDRKSSLFNPFNRT